MRTETEIALDKACAERDMWRRWANQKGAMLAYLIANIDPPPRTDSDGMVKTWLRTEDNFDTIECDTIECQWGNDSDYAAALALFEESETIESEAVAAVQQCPRIGDDLYINKILWGLIDLVVTAEPTAETHQRKWWTDSVQLLQELHVMAGPDQRDEPPF